MRNVTVHLPQGKSKASFTPPKTGAQPSATNAWLKAIVGAISNAKKKPARSLVLTTSLKTSEALAEQLKDKLPNHVVIDGSKRSLAENKALFLRAAKQGPVIWIAQGPAWTGLDIADDLLDRLYIARLPMGQPSVHEDDRSGKDFAESRIRMILQLKQGVGRLVRSRAGRKKALWLLDGRWDSPTMDVASVFEGYAQKAI